MFWKSTLVEMPTCLSCAWHPRRQWQAAINRRENAFMSGDQEDQRRGSPCCALSSLLALKIDPALGRRGSELLTAPEIAIRNPRSAAIPYEFPRYLHLAREKGLPERVQAECQCRAPSCNFLNCIVFSKLGGDRAAWTSGDSWGTGGPVPPGRWFSAMGWRSLSPRVKIRPVPNCRLENVVVDKSPL